MESLRLAISRSYLDHHCCQSEISFILCPHFGRWKKFLNVVHISVRDRKLQCVKNAITGARLLDISLAKCKFATKEHHLSETGSCCSRYCTESPMKVELCNTPRQHACLRSKTSIQLSAPAKMASIAWNRTGGTLRMYRGDNRSSNRIVHYLHTHQWLGCLKYRIPQKTSVSQHGKCSKMERIKI